MDLGLRDRVVIVTGAGSGMGAAVSDAYASEGATVIAADITFTEGSDSAGSSGDAQFRTWLDVTDRAAWSNVVERTLGHWGRIDVLCNIAGPGATTGHLDTGDDEWARQIDGHLKSVFLGCQSVLPSMMGQRSGKIVNMASFTAHGYSEMIPAYAAAFGGVVSYSRTLALFGAKYGINVNCVSPGNIETPMTRTGWLEDEDSLRSLEARIPIGRVGQPDDVANWFVFLGSDRARHAVGVEVNVSGGQVIY